MHDNSPKKLNQTLPLVDLDNARLSEQRDEMAEILKSGNCPFCVEHLNTYHNLPFLKKGTYWWLTPNKWPYDYTKVHLLAISTKHLTDLSQLEPAAGAELIELCQWAQKHFSIKGGGLVLRFGDTKYSAGSVQHLHAQLVSPDIDADGYQPVRIKIGKSPENL